MAHLQRVVIVGVGLLGGSLGLALRKRGLAQTVVGVSRRTATLKQAQAMGAITDGSTELASAADADLVIVCTPVQRIAQLVRQSSQQLSPGGWITDVGSTKHTICDQLRDVQDHFIGSHPLAGSDKSGVEHASSELMTGKTTIITPTENSPSDLIERARQFWTSLGSKCVCMAPEDHDQAVARTSHLPHVVAAALAAATDQKLLPLAASGWCDTTRVAAGNVDMWLQILHENRGPLLSALGEYAGALQQWIEALEAGDDSTLKSLLSAGKTKRDTLGN